MMRQFLCHGDAALLTAKPRSDVVDALKQNDIRSVSRFGILFTSLEIKVIEFGQYIMQTLVIAHNEMQLNFFHNTIINFLQKVITGPPTHGGSIVLLSGVCYRLSGSVTLHGGPAGGFTRADQAMTLCRLQCIIIALR